MIKTLHERFGIRDVAIYDDTFAVNRERAAALCEMLIRERMGITWSCNLRADIADPSLLAMMKKAGCWQVGFGIESGSPACLEFYRKGITIPMVRDAIRAFRKAGILCHGNIMVGTLPETLESLEATKEFVLHSGLDFLTVNMFTPLPGSLDYQRAGEYGKFNNDWTRLNQHDCVFQPKGIPEATLNLYVKNIIAGFYFRPRFRLLRHFCTMKLNPEVLKILFKGIIAVLNYIRQ